MKYSILITTYHKRFEAWFKPLLIEIKRQRPDIEVIVSINGELEYFEENYRNNILDFLKEYKNVFPIFYPRFRGLSRIWNLGIQFSSEENVLVISDDISLEEGFFNNYEHVLKDYQFFTINVSWSVFSITKTLLIKMNWFDERFLGLGWEDGEFLRRFEKQTGSKFPNTNLEACKNGVDPAYYNYNKKLNDFLKTEIRLEGQKLDNEFNRYSEFNFRMHESVLSSINQYPLESFYLENKEKLK